MKRTILSLLLCLFWAVAAFPQAKGNTVSLNLKVLSQEDGLPMMGVTCVITDYGIYAITDEKGEAVLAKIPKGEAEVFLQMLGYEDFKKKINFQDNVNLSVKMELTSLELEQVVVTAKSSAAGSSTSSSIGRMAIDHLQATSLKDIMQLLPGQLMSNSDMTSEEKLTIRTLSASTANNAFGTSIMVDGVPMSDNTSFDARTADITVTADVLVETIKVSQLAAVPSIAVSAETVALAADGAVQTVDVVTNAPFSVSVSEGAEWLTVEKAEASISISAVSNLILKSRSAVVTVKEDVGGKAVEIAVSQDAAQPSRYTDSLALVAFYNAADGANWAKGKWDLSTPIDTWCSLNSKGEFANGVQVDAETGRVIQIFIATKSITADWSLPEEIGDLTELQRLRIGSNAVVGALPESIYNLTKLKQFDLSNNNLAASFTADIAKWQDLEQISILGNKGFTGGIPKEIGQLKKLYQINFNKTSLGGSIPAEIAGCESLTQFMAFEAELTGEVPDIFDQFTKNFSILQLYNNHLEGALPASLGNVVTSATSYSIQIYNNNFTGNVPETYANLPKACKQLFINGNRLQGVVPAAVKAHANWTTWKPAERIFPQQEGYGLE